MLLTKEQIISEIEILLVQGHVGVSFAEFNESRYVDYTTHLVWHTKSCSILDSFLPFDNSLVVTFKQRGDCSVKTTLACIGLLEVVKEQIEKGIINIAPATPNNIPFDILSLIFSKFHQVARQLRVRHANRRTLDVKDEYDVQDLLHALLKIHFDDIRPEEWTPSYAGSGSRIDFLLKDEKIVIEVKHTRTGLTDRKLGEELIIDIEKYKTHPDCQQLVCFVYDPEGKLGNPKGIENDLMNTHEGFVNVFILP